MNKKFIPFILTSGLGWLIDFFSFLTLIHLLSSTYFLANLCSSFFGVTFVWFSSLKRIFHSNSGNEKKFLIFYWLFQFFSILFYSKILLLIADQKFIAVIMEYIPLGRDALAKFIVTPFNLVTNYFFMTILVHIMSNKKFQNV